MDRLFRSVEVVIRRWIFREEKMRQEAFRNQALSVKAPATILQKAEFASNGNRGLEIRSVEPLI